MIQCSLLPCYLILDINPTQYVIIGAKNEKSHHKKIYLKFYRFIKTSAQTTKNRHSCLPMMTVVDASANVIKKMFMFWDHQDINLPTTCTETTVL